MKIFTPTTIRARWSRISILSMAGLAAVVLYAWHYRLEPSLQAEVEAKQKELSRRAADNIAEFVQRKADRLITVGEVGRLWEGRGEVQQQALARLMKLDPQIRDVAYADHIGRERLKLSRDRVLTDADLADVAGLESFRAAAQGRIYVSPVQHASNADPFVTIAVPVRFTAAAVSGVISADVRLKTLWSAVDEISEQTKGVVSVFDEKGLLIAHPDYSLVLAAGDRRGKALTTSSTSAQSVPGDARARGLIVSHAQVPHLGWTVVVEEPADAVLAEIHKLEGQLLLLFGIAFIGAVVAASYFTRRIAQAVAALEQGAQRIASGKLDHRLEIHTGDEIERLAEQFNRMAGALSSSYGDLENKVAARTKELAALYAALAPLAGSQGVNEKFNNVIDRLIAVTGSDAALIRIQSKESGQLAIIAHRGVSPDYFATVGQAATPGSVAASVLQLGQAVFSPDMAADERFLTNHLTNLGFISTAVLPLVVQGKVSGVVQLVSRTYGFFDASKAEQLVAIAHLLGVVVENHELLQASEKTAEELFRSNRELEQFAYVASHDLQEPLRMIAGYTQLIARRYGGRLDDTARDYIGFIVDGAKRMRLLIDDLLLFSRVGNKKWNLAPADCAAVLQTTLRNLDAAIASSGASVTYDGLPVVSCDQRQLGQLFQNLVANGLKYCRGRAPKIHICCRARDNDWLFAVSDNGIGIAPEYADKIFVIFQRLHTKEEYSGTGIGLSICKKIVEGHGGKIWVESQVGQGSTFYFTLPRALAEAGERLAS